MWYKVKRIMVGDKQVRPSYEWTPDASRTLLYLPLESNATDYSWNSRSTSPSNITYANLWWVMCANANGSSSKISVTPTTFLSSSDTQGTMSMLVYGSSRSSTARQAIEFASSTSWVILRYQTNDNRTLIGWFDWFRPNPSVNNWHHIVLTFDSSYCYCYIDGEYYWTTNRSIDDTPIWWRSPDVTWFNVFANRSWNTNRWSWWGRELIFENIKWSAEDVSKYYQRIKAKLWF